ncbi:MAG: hypothetical protein C4530_02180 [Desulfobacteraceae bacterium]|nr:MAG: hypothetical protein C4530_02180 [Desulfobacteraceae bacterium]
MSLPKRTIRGLANIRTHSATRDQVSESYKAFLRIGALEMEKARRGKEKESALNRVQNIDARFREIEAEKSELLAAIGIPSTGDACGNPANGPKRAPARNKGGFKVSY